MLKKALADSSANTNDQDLAHTATPDLKVCQRKVELHLFKLNVLKLAK